MKKILSFLTVFFLLLLCGCRITDGGMSSRTYIEYSSNAIYVDENGSELDDETVSQIELQINQEFDDQATVSETISANASSNDNTNSSEASSQTGVISDAVADEVQEIVEADVNTAGEKPLYYTYLTASQQRIYRFMKTAAEQMTTGYFSVGATISGEDRFSDIAIAYRALSSDNPQIFWLPEFYMMSADGSAMAFSDENEGVDYTLTPQEKKMAEQQLYTTVNNLVTQASALKSRFEKELFFHDWLCQNVTYDFDGTDNVYTVYGALINGVAVCEGYSRAMQLLCDSVGIPCTVIYGRSNDIAHMWNIINPGDGWYHLDVTWDDDEKNELLRHTYVNLNDEQIAVDHIIFDAVSVGKSYVGNDDFNLCLYACNKDKYNYFVKNGLVFTDDVAAAAQTVKEANNEGLTSIEVLYTGSTMDYKAFLNRVNRELYESGSSVWLSKYSCLGNAIVIWW